MKHPHLRIAAISILASALLTMPAANAAKRNRMVRVVTVTQDGLKRETGATRLEETMQRLDRAASFQPDIVCLPETFTRAEPEEVPGPTTTRLTEWAREHNSWVICPILVRDGDQVFNSAILIDRSGSIVGRYDKIHPTENELARAICPGSIDPPVFQTDFGTVGIQICFDVNWRRQWNSLKAKGAEIIFFPSAFPAARQVQSLAWLNQCYVVTSTITRQATIFDITGDSISTTGQYRRWAGAVLPLGKRLFEIDFHVSKMRAIERKYGRQVEVTWYHDDDLVSLASIDDELTVEDLIREFDLTPHTAYIDRARQAQDAKRIEQQ
jgi:predicted amidohydrolase